MSNDGKFLVVTFKDDDNPPNQYVEAVPFSYVHENCVFWPKHSRDIKHRSNINHVPNYGDSKNWEKWPLGSVKGL